jgi:D-alanyl-D-alanine carboxypeptidase
MTAPRGERRPKRRNAVLIALAAVVSASTFLVGTTPALASAAARPGATHATSGPDVELRTLLNDVVSTGVPGIIARVQDGREIRLAAAGVADLATGAALQPQARFRVGSISKTFVATVVLQLVGERRLALDEPVARWLPGLLADGNRITVRELLNHTSGLFDYTADPTLLAGIVHNRVWDPTELVAIAERHPSTFPPGSAWGYSSTNYIVAGLLVEAVTHHPLARELQQRIFGPLRLDDTSFPVATAYIRGDHAHGYVPTTFVPTPGGKPFDVTAFNPSHAWAAGAIVSDAADLSRFYRDLMDGRLLPPRLLREMKTTVAENPADPTYFRYGLGIERVQDPCGTNWGHTGAIFGYQDMTYWNEQTGRTVVLADTMYPPGQREPQPPGQSHRLRALRDVPRATLHGPADSGGLTPRPPACHSPVSTRRRGTGNLGRFQIMSYEGTRLYAARGVDAAVGTRGYRRLLES